ncbi:MAG: hypothetical protein HY919_07390 [Elusimicrobia bacterium]|nr:hypothetical protein [Elusimicrobiota bacterium]
MEKEKIIEALITDELCRGVRFYHRNRELSNVQEIVQKILGADEHLMIDNSCSRPEIVN